MAIAVAQFLPAELEGRVPDVADMGILFLKANRPPPYLPVYLALNLARTRVHGRQFWSLAAKTDGVWGWSRTRGGIVVSRVPVKRKTPLSLVDNGGQEKRVIGLEPTTFTLAT